MSVFYSLCMLLQGSFLVIPFLTYYLKNYWCVPFLLQAMSYLMWEMMLYVVWVLYAPTLISS